MNISTALVLNTCGLYGTFKGDANRMLFTTRDVHEVVKSIHFFTGSGCLHCHLFDKKMPLEWCDQFMTPSRFVLRLYGGVAHQNFGVQPTLTDFVL